MNILAVYAKNFGSYAELYFNPNNQGLCLIYGPTGSGKSTLPDVVAWTLFGITAKNGNVDDIKSWSTPDEPTIGEVMIEGPDITVVRTRGKTNDLYWIDSVGGTHRGTDLLDTQLLLDALLCTTAELYLTSCYWSEFSPTSSFFLSNAKTRREVLERVTDLSLPIKLSNATTAAKKIVKTETKTIVNQLSRLEGAVDQIQSTATRLASQAKDWETERRVSILEEKLKSEHFVSMKESRISALQTKRDHFEATKLKELETLQDKILSIDESLTQIKGTKCETCGTVKGADKVAKLKGDRALYDSQLNSKIDSSNPFDAQLESVAKEDNACESRIEDLRAQINPHNHYLSDVQGRLLKHQADLDAKRAELAALNARLSSLEQLYDFSFELRGQLLQIAIRNIEDQTNKYLEEFFDSEFRVGFTIENGDALEVSIRKGGYSCVYRQLSKGQRQLLKLCFSISVMSAAANTAGIHFEQIWMDEALDGLDTALKVKAFALFEELAQNHASVFLIDHAPEFQELFSSKYKCTISGDTSSIEAET